MIAVGVVFGVVFRGEGEEERGFVDCGEDLGCFYGALGICRKSSVILSNESSDIIFVEGFSNKECLIIWKTNATEEKARCLVPEEELNQSIVKIMKKGYCGDYLKELSAYI